VWHSHAVHGIGGSSNQVSEVTQDQTCKNKNGANRCEANLDPGHLERASFSASTGMLLKRPKTPAQSDNACDGEQAGYCKLAK
jgi:hypothetical protein